MQAKPLRPHRSGRSVKSVAFLALTMAMALVSALLIVYNLGTAADLDPLAGVSGGQTGTVLLAGDQDPADHSSLANTKLPSEPNAYSNHNASD